VFSLGAHTLFSGRFFFPGEKFPSENCAGNKYTGAITGWTIRRRTKTKQKKRCHGNVCYKDQQLKELATIESEMAGAGVIAGLRTSGGWTRFFPLLGLTV
jgi:hypothetical protein